MKIRSLVVTGSMILMIIAFGFITTVCADVPDVKSGAQPLSNYENVSEIIAPAGDIFSEPILTSAPAPILVVERDTIRSVALRSPDEALVINHEICLLNNLNQSITVNFSSFVPGDKYKRCKFYPAFGSNALLDLPLFMPAYMQSRVKNITWLDNILYDAPPEVNITETEEGAVYHYDNVTIEPGVAVIAVYENYYDTMESLYTPYGLNTTNLAVFESYRVFYADNQTIFNLNYELKNTGNNTIYGIRFGTFFPYRNISEKTLSSPNVTCTEVTMQDGTGEWAKGYLCVLNLRTLDTNSQYQYSLNFSTSTPPQSSLQPVLILTYPTDKVEGEEERIWHPWELNIEDIDMENEVSRIRYYTMVTMIIPDAYNLSIDNQIPAPTAALLPAPTGTSPTPGFELITVIIGLLTAAYLHRKSRFSG